MLSQVLPLLKPFLSACALAALLTPLPGSTARAQDTAKDAILILDASGSMWGQIDGVNKIVIAKDVVEGLVRSIPSDQRLGFVAYGHRRKGDCKDIQTLAGIGTDRGKLIDTLRALSPKGKTPLTQSVEVAARTLNYTKNAATVILVSDGLENCDADPCALARTLEANGLDFTIHVVGFDVTREERGGLECLASETGGLFLTADTADQLSDALGEVAVALPAAVPEVAAPAEEQPTGDGAPLPRKIVLKATILPGGPLIQSDLNWQVVETTSGTTLFTATDTGIAETEIPPGEYRLEAAWTGWREGGQKLGVKDITVDTRAVQVFTVPVDLALPVTLDAPDQTPEGVPVDVRWSGPDALGALVTVNALDDGPRDAIYMFPTQRARAAHEKSATPPLDTDGDGDFDQDDLATAALGGPSIAGQYEIRYVLDKPRVILARRPLTVTDSLYSVSAPATVTASDVFQVQWDGPLTQDDFVTIVPAGHTTAFERGFTARLVAGKPAQLRAPATPGDYEVRYVLANGYTLYPGMQQVVQASTPLRVAAASASVSAPATAVGGSTIEIAYTGPGDGMTDDIISVVPAGATKSNRDSAIALRPDKSPDGKTVRLRVPAIEGAYEVAYVLQPGQKVIARQPLTITRATATVDAPDRVKLGESFEVTYQGDGFKGDRIIVTPAETPDAKMWGWGTRYGFAAEPEATTGTIRANALSKPGRYEVRYVTGLQHQVLARDTLLVEE